jgi:hypothetical protein
VNWGEGPRAGRVGSDRESQTTFVDEQADDAAVVHELAVT